MGVVFEVEREGRRFALKRLHPALADSRSHTRFLREAELLKKLDHPGIVAVREIAADHGEPYMVMELVEGTGLLDAARTWALDRKLEAVTEVCAAVEAAHARGLLHRDLKPQNVLVRRDGRCVLVDFGLGTAENDPSLTSTGELLGTLRYMAPEQARGEKADARADVWGLGQILFELVLERPAIDASSRAMVLRALERDHVPRPSKLKPEISRDLERVLLAALAFEREHRYESACELRLDLERLRSGAAVRARPPGFFVRSWSRARRKPALVLVALLAVLALAVATIALRSAQKRERFDSARWHLERAFIVWSSGNLEPARRETQAALRLVPNDPAAMALHNAIDAVPDAAHGEWSDSFNALREGRALEAAQLLETSAERDSFAGILAAHAYRSAGDTARAGELLDELALRAPGSLAVAVERGRNMQAAGDATGAIVELRRAVALSPQDVRLKLELAQALLSSGEEQQGVAEALKASQLGLAQREVSLPELARMLKRAQQPARAREALEAAIALDASRSDAQFALAVLYDFEHRIVDAAHSYEAAVSADPANSWALAYLGHLRAGADHQRCAACRAAFDAAPELRDREAAGQLLAAAVTSDRGQDPDLLRTVVFLARDHALSAPVVAALEQVLRGEVSRAGRSRLLDALEGLRR
jgi:tetratricopeptide (TPR) repeat protein